MKHSLAKMTGILLVMCLLLTGCNLIAVDPAMQLEEDMKALEKDYATVLANYDGGTITKEEVMANFLYLYSYYGSMYAYMGYTIDDTMINSFKRNAIDVIIQNRAIEKEFENRGLSLTDEKLSELKAEAETTYQEAYDYYLENAAGDTDDVRQKQAAYDMYRDGYIYEHVERELITAAKYDMLIEQVRGEVAEISEEALKEGYDSRVASDEDLYEYDFASFESAMMGDTTLVTWMPEGYRTVKHILIIPEDEAVMQNVIDARNACDEAETALADLEAELVDANDDDDEDTAEGTRTAEEIQADIDNARAALSEKKAAVTAAEAACLAAMQDVLDEIYAAIEAGEDFDALIEKYGADPGMQEEPTMSRGYYVNADSESWDQNFTDGAMLLEKVGDVSETPVISNSGLHIIRYESDVPAGAVDFETVREDLYDVLLEEAQADHVNALLTEWVDGLNASYDISTFNVDLSQYGY